MTPSTVMSRAQTNASVRVGSCQESKPSSRRHGLTGVLPAAADGAVCSGVSKSR